MGSPIESLPILTTGEDVQCTIALDVYGESRSYGNVSIVVMDHDRFIASQIVDSW